MECTIERDGDEYVVTGRKWWSSGAGDPRCKIAIVMGTTSNPDAKRFVDGEPWGESLVDNHNLTLGCFLHTTGTSATV